MTLCCNGVVAVGRAHCTSRACALVLLVLWVSVQMAGPQAVCLRVRVLRFVVQSGTFCGSGCTLRYLSSRYSVYHCPLFFWLSRSSHPGVSSVKPATNLGPMCVYHWAWRAGF
ncbi:hypothetical protein LXA43DRAFT_1010390 [Ganoderma leucocontextum]|nr:hypothetical protein LXA43DRAFT_1010390 [Ganoderma leucocontextum]